MTIVIGLLTFLDQNEEMSFLHPKHRNKLMGNALNTLAHANNSMLVSNDAMLMDEGIIY